MNQIVRTFLAFVLTTIAVGPAMAQTAMDPAVTACKSTGLIAIKQTSPDVTDLVIDMESLAINKADTKVEDVSVKTVILGEAYFSRSGKTDNSKRFVCLLGDKDKVLLTYFTAQ